MHSFVLLTFLVKQPERSNKDTDIQIYHDTADKSQVQASASCSYSYVIACIIAIVAILLTEG